MGEWFWNLYAKSYDSIAELIPYQNLMADILREAKIQDGFKVLDIGCGTGNLENRILKVCSKPIIESIDFSSSMLAIAKKKVPCETINFELVDLRNGLTYPDQEFDVIIVNNVLYALPNVEVIVSEMFRVLKIGGHLIISDPKKRSSFLAIFREHKKLENPINQAALLSRARLMASLLTTCLLNVVIEVKGRNGNYKFRSSEEWNEILNRLTPRITYSNCSTYANQNWLINIQRDS